MNEFVLIESCFVKFSVAMPTGTTEHRPLIVRSVKAST